MFILDCFERDMIKNVLLSKRQLGTNQLSFGYESTKLWVRIILALGTNHLNFGYESSGYETSMGTKRPDSDRWICRS